METSEPVAEKGAGSPPDAIGLFRTAGHLIPIQVMSPDSPRQQN
ncbi:MAG: hypothetical protein ACP5D7_13065 [Limnospira sp.]